MTAPTAVCTCGHVFRFHVSQAPHECVAASADSVHPGSCPCRAFAAGATEDREEAAGPAWLLRWFGTDWGAPVCREARQVTTPRGEICYLCAVPIGVSDDGFAWPARIEVGAARLVTHRACFERALGLEPAPRTDPGGQS